MIADSKISQPITVLGVNCGEGDTFMESEILRSADLISGASRFLEKLGQSGKYENRLLPFVMPVDKYARNLERHAAAGKKIVVLADGDPLFFGIGATLVRILGSHMVKVLSAVSSMQIACARMGLPWHSLAFVSVHGRKDLQPFNAAIQRGLPVCVLTGTGPGPDFMARLLLDRGCGHFAAHIFENLGSTGEQHRVMGLEECANTNFSDCLIMILMPVGDVELPLPGIAGHQLAGHYCTTRPVRGIILELLRIRPTDTVWDIGSGSGALAIEFASQARAGTVISVEERPERALDIQLNRQKFAAINLEICLGHAPACLAGLPPPDKIFVGGGLSGMDCKAILHSAMEYLAVGGQLVICCILLESFLLARNLLRERELPLEIFQTMSAREEPLGKGSYLAPGNPVFLISATKQI